MARTYPRAQYWLILCIIWAGLSPACKEAGRTIVFKNTGSGLVTVTYQLGEESTRLEIGPLDKREFSLTPEQLARLPEKKLIYEVQIGSLGSDRNILDFTQNRSRLIIIELNENSAPES